MNRTIYLTAILALSLCIMTGCKNKDAGNKSTTEKADSTKQKGKQSDATKNAVPEWDKVTCEVKGPVKKIVSGEEIINFGMDGKISEWTGLGVKANLSRTTDRITKVYYVDCVMIYTYDVKKGRISQTERLKDDKTGRLTTYNYDAKGNVESIKIKETTLNEYNELIEAANATHAVKESRDSLGNWTSRTINGETVQRVIYYY